MRTATAAPFLPALQKLAEDARETAAADLFGIEAVRMALMQTACLGRNRLFLRPKIPLDLQRTTAAKALTAHLAEMGLSTFWHPYSIEQDGRQEQGYELEIAWQKPE